MENQLDRLPKVPAGLIEGSTLCIGSRQLFNKRHVAFRDLPENGRELELPAPYLSDGKPLWRSPGTLPLGIGYRLMIIGNSAATVMLVGPLEVWEGVRQDLDWSKVPK